MYREIFYQYTYIINLKILLILEEDTITFVRFLINQKNYSFVAKYFILFCLTHYNYTNAN